MKKIILFTVLLITLLNNCFADEVDDAGIRTPLVERRKDLRFKDERDAYAEFLLLLQAAQGEKEKGTSDWLEYFDAAALKLKEVQNSKSVACRELALTAAEKSSFQELWKSRYSLGTVLNDNLGEIAQVSPLAIVFAQSAHGLIDNIARVNGVYDMAEARGNHEGFEVVSGALPGPELTGPVPIVAPSAYVIRFARPKGKDVAKSALVLYGATYRPQNLADGQKRETLKLAAAIVCAASGWANPEFVHPVLALSQHILQMGLAADGIAPVATKIWSKWGKECPFKNMKTKLEKDKKEQQETENNRPTAKQQEEKPFTAPYNPYTDLLPSFTIPEAPADLNTTEKEAEEAENF